ncbi:discoidin, CUB and LCCL domain-containing protein 1 isoform X1 [Platichthys flesus]|uniref:discoidin, CUB and LCCL domain-containing protein 1 isoform X1 n=1 Tax=Platichthys flesus TaxID=8260 RepID=UPI002DBD7339|nr:discoidin, CUB and LCCL domain-containing protein 1 isoform X1 [Platichthys flesus]XP_062254803.1 discoidin, CUB and LCCL domain-containing protein 1 isoform X1 [Platichthys flesus]
MPATWEHTGCAGKSAVAGVWIVFSVCSAVVRAQEGDGCGHTLLGTESGTLASLNYPGTYPSNTLCKWRVRVPEGRTLQLLFGDFDVESSPDCRNGSLVITDKNGTPWLGPVCGKLDEMQKNVTLVSNEVIITFMSGPHRSGRGFLLSYTTDQYADLISCLTRGSHFSSQHLSVYCPAGCKSVAGDVWGNSERGYRDTSVLCKSAVHAGATSDTMGGRVTVTRDRSLTLYESTFANGILSKTGSLSEKKLLFSQECNNILPVSGLNASSVWNKNSQEHRRFWSSRNMDSSHEFLLWTAANNDANPWVELELSDKSTITGIITMGSNEYYTESYTLLFSRDRKTWKPYKGALSKDKKVFQAYTEGHLRVLNSLSPPVVARFIRLEPLSWQGRASAQVQVRGCPVTKLTPRSRSPGESPPIQVYTETQRPGSSPTTTDGPVLVETRPSTSQAVIVAVGVVLGLIMCGSCLLAGVWWKRRKKISQMKYSLPKIGCQSFQAKSLPCPQSELISYPLERNVHDALPSPPLNDYAEPTAAAIGQKVGSTFRPSTDEGYTTPFILNHYDTPGNLPEYAEPLPPEPEYATPFGDQPSESNLPTLTGRLHSNAHGPPVTGPPPTTSARTASSHTQYDCPSHRMLSNGYCTPALHISGPRPVSVVYAEPTSCDSLLQNPTYEEPL